MAVKEPGILNRSVGTMIRHLVSNLSLLGFSTAVCFGETPADGKWIPLFNGRDMTGWTPKVADFPLGENPGNLFRVEGGLLKVSYVNGKEVLRYQNTRLDNGTPLTSGYIAIQAETHPIEFRKIEIPPLLTVRPESARP